VEVEVGVAYLKKLFQDSHWGSQKMQLYSYTGAPQYELRHVEEETQFKFNFPLEPEVRLNTHSV
jgi:hypothetical protein